MISVYKINEHSPFNIKYSLNTIEYDIYQNKYIIYYSTRKGKTTKVSYLLYDFKDITNNKLIDNELAHRKIHKTLFNTKEHRFHSFTTDFFFG